MGKMNCIIVVKWLLVSLCIIIIGKSLNEAKRSAGEVNEAEGRTDVRVCGGEI